MAIVEIDTLQRVRDMTFDNGLAETQFRVARITSVEIEDATYLLMSGEVSGLAVALIEPTGGLAFIDAYGTNGTNTIANATLGAGFTTHPSVASFEKNGTSYAYVGSTVDIYNQSSGRIDQFNAISGFEIAPNGTPDFIQHRQVDNVPGGGGTVSSFGSDPQFASPGGRDMLITPVNPNRTTEGVFKTYAIRDNGSLRPLAETEPFTYDFAKFDTVEKSGNTFVVAFGQFDIAPLQVLKLNPNGKMKQVFELPISDGAIFNRITTDIETIEIGNRSFVIVSEVTRGSILVYEIQKSGRLMLVEQENPGRFDGWSSPEALVTFEDGGKNYLAAGGYGNSLGVFQISDGGALTEVDEFTFDDPAIRFVYDLDARDLADGRQYIFASTATVDEVRSFRFIGENDAISSGKRRLNGTEEDDQITGRGKDNILNGFEGDDLIEGRRGKDKLLGGEGEDNLFGGDGRDTLKGGDGYDFLFGESGNDRLVAEGGNDFANGGNGDDRVFGGIGNDVLLGASGNDRLFGEDGLDRLVDGTGRDQMTGGSGNDIFVFYKDGKTDTVLDYEDNRDQIDLTEFGRGLEFSDLIVRQSGSAVTVEVMGERIVINSATGEIRDFELSLGDFVFA